MIFAVFDPSPLTVCINCSFLHLFIIIPMHMMNTELIHGRYKGPTVSTINGDRC